MPVSLMDPFVGRNRKFAAKQHAAQIRKHDMLVSTTHGLIDDSLLVKKIVGSVVEYYFDGELVHRSATAQLTGASAEGIAKV